MVRPATRWILAALALLGAVPVRSSGAVILGSGSRLSLEGDSTLHKFSAKTSSMTMAWEAPDAGEGNLKSLILDGKVKILRLTLPVKGLKSGESGLDKNMYKAMNAEKEPAIVWAMSGYSVEASSLPAIVLTEGDLAINGTHKPARLRAALGWLPDGSASLEGEYPLLMSDFGIAPPTIMLGAIKVKDPVVIRFHLEIKDSGAGAKQ